MIPKRLVAAVLERDGGVCVIPSCDRPIRGHGWCSKHYSRWRRWGDPLATVRVVGRDGCSVDGCLRKHYGRGWCRLHYDRVRGNGSTSTAVQRGDLDSRLVHYAVRNGECIEFSGHRDKDGYGDMTVNGKFVRAHRAAYEMTHGPIPPGHVVRHKCDNPPCINPLHLETGTVADNNQDKVERGRSTAGARNGSARLTEDEALSVFVLGNRGSDVSGLARRFGISQTQVRRIVRAESWQEAILRRGQQAVNDEPAA